MQPIHTLDSSHSSPNFSSRRGLTPTSLVMSYTASPEERSLYLLTRNDVPLGSRVSAHYLVPTRRNFAYHLVDEEHRAYHAGAAEWHGERDVNSTSIGISSVNWGYTYGWVPTKPETPSLIPLWMNGVRLQRVLFEPLVNRGMPLLSRSWHDYPQEQIDTLVSLSQMIVEKWKLRPSMVIGHSDVAVGRKVDPGPRFPWKTLADHGVGMWPDQTVDRLYTDKPQGSSIPWLQKSLASWGFKTPQSGKLDARTSAVVKAFQLHFRQDKFDGWPDAETYDRLDQLICQRRWQEVEPDRAKAL